MTQRAKTMRATGKTCTTDLLFEFRRSLNRVIRHRLQQDIFPSSGNDFLAEFVAFVGFQSELITRKNVLATTLQPRDNEEKNDISTSQEGGLGELLVEFFKDTGRVAHHFCDTPGILLEPCQVTV